MVKADQNNSSQFYLSENNLPYSDFMVFGISVDCVLFGYEKGTVKVLMIKRGASPFKNYWALPGDLVNPQEDLDNSATHVLKKLTGLEDVFMEQFHSFGSVNRHPVGRVVTVGYYSLIKIEKYQPIASACADQLEWVNIDELSELAFDHQDVLQKAIETLKKKVRTEPIGFELLPDKFTLLELQELYEVLLVYKFDKPNFRKKILSMNLLVSLKEVQDNVAHRPAKLFKFDERRYMSLKKEGFSFEL